MTEGTASSDGEQTRRYTYGELTFGFTTTFTFDYNDKGNGASRDGAFHHPVLPR